MDKETTCKTCPICSRTFEDAYLCAAYDCEFRNQEEPDQEEPDQEET